MTDSRPCRSVVQLAELGAVLEPDQAETGRFDRCAEVGQRTKLPIALSGEDVSAQRGCAAASCSGPVRSRGGLRGRLGEGAVVAYSTLGKQLVPGIAILRCVDDGLEQDRAVFAGVIVEHLENVLAHELVLPDVHRPVIHAIRLDRVEDLDSAPRPGLGISEPRLLGHRTAVSIAHDWLAHFFILMATGTARAFDGVRLNNGVSATGLVHLRAAGTSLLLDCGGTLLPRVLHWGAVLGELSDDDMAALLRVSMPQLVTNTLDEVVQLSVIPELSTGWLGTPGIAGHRNGADFSTSFRLRSLDVTEPADELVQHSLIIDAADTIAGLALRLEIELTRSGLVRQRATVQNTAESTFSLDAVLLTLPVPAEATQLLDLTGRHLRERSPHVTTSLLALTCARNGAAVPGRMHRSSSPRVRPASPSAAVDLGDARRVEWQPPACSRSAHPAGTSLLGGGELLLPGEVRLAAGETYTKSVVFGAYGIGLEPVTARFHRYLRARPHHPRTPRPVTLNTWEAVYFDQSLDRCPRWRRQQPSRSRAFRRRRRLVSPSPQRQRRPR